MSSSIPFVGRFFVLLLLAVPVALWANSAGAVVVFTEDFELPVVAGYAQGTSPVNWVKASEGYRSNWHGLNNKGSGDFTAPVGNDQAYAFRYTNSGLTTAEGVIGAFAPDVTYTISFDVATDLGGLTVPGTPYRVEFIALDPGANRAECRGGRPGLQLATATGNATLNDMSESATFGFVVPSGHASVGKDIGIRLMGATNSALIDNVLLDAVTNVYWDINDTAPGAGGVAPAGTWNAANTNWNGLSDGTGSTVAWSANSAAVFAAGSDATDAYTVTVEGTQDIGGLKFQEGTVTITGGTALRMTSIANTVDVASGLAATIETPLSENVAGRPLIKSGNGTLILFGANTYTGPTTVGAGTLVLDANDVLPDVSDVTVRGDAAGVTATLDLDENDETIASLTLGGATNSSGAAVTTGAGTLTLGGDVTYNSANNPLGATISGKLELGATRTFTVNNSTTANDLTVSADISGTGAGLTKEGAGRLVLSGNNAAATGGMALNAGITQFDSAASINGTARDVTVNAGGTVVFGPSFGAGNIPAALLNRIVADSAGVIAADNYAADNFDFDTPGLTDAYLGAVGNVPYAGTLTPNATGGWRLGGGGGTLTFNPVATGAGYTMAIGGNVVLSGANDYDGATTIHAGVLQANNATALGNGGNITFAGGTLQYTAASAGQDWGARIKNSTGVINLDTNNQTVTLAGAIDSSNTAGLAKIGTGSLILGVANTYTGPTTVTAGTLQVTHADAIASSSGLTLAGGSAVLNTTVNLNALTFENSNANSTVSGGTLNFTPGGDIHHNIINKTLTITSGITGSPAVRIASGKAQNDLHFYPDVANQALGVITAPYYNSNNADKCELRFGGTTTGNTVEAVTYVNTDPDTGSFRNCHYGYMYKVGTGTWTVNGDVEQGKLDVQKGTLIINGTFTSKYQGLYAIPSGARLGGDLTYLQTDSRFGHFNVNSGGILAPGNPDVDNGVGTISIEYGYGRNDAAKATFNDGSIYEWQVAQPGEVGQPHETDTVHFIRASAKPRTLDLDNFVLKILDAGGYVASETDHLPVFTYDTGVVIDMAGFSDLPANFDTSALNVGLWDWSAGLHLIDDTTGTIYLTGLKGGVNYSVLEWDGGPGDWSISNWSGGQAPVADTAMVINADTNDSVVTYSGTPAGAAASIEIGDGYNALLTVDTGAALGVTGEVAVGEFGALNVEGTLACDSLLVNSDATVNTTGGNPIQVAASATLDTVTITYHETGAAAGFTLAGADLADNTTDRTVAIDGADETVDISDSSGPLNSPKTHVAVAADNMTLNVPSGDPVVLGDLSLGSAVLDVSITGGAPSVSFDDVSAAAGEVGIEATGGELVIVRGSMDPGTIDGEMGPGGSLGEIYVAGNVAFAAGSALHIEVQGTDSDLLAVLGDIDLGAVGSAATLEFNWLPGGDGDSGSEFGGTYEILAYTGTLTGEFDSVSSNIGLPYFGGAPTLEDAIDYGDGTDDVISLNLWDLVTGDVTLDGIVNSSDFTIMAANWQDAGLWTEGNVNFDDIINSSDFTDMAANWQSTPVAPLMPAPPAAAFSAVPEPSTFVLALLGLLGIGAYRARRRKA